MKRFLSIIVICSISTGIAIAQNPILEEYLQFRSFRQPLIVFLAIPFAITGMIWALIITGNTFSFTAFIGLTSLVGIVVNNSIILTALTTIGGLLPVNTYTCSCLL